MIIEAICITSPDSPQLSAVCVLSRQHCTAFAIRFSQCRYQLAAILRLQPQSPCTNSKLSCAGSQETEVAPIIADYWERAEFPHEIIPKLAKLGLGGGTIKGFGCAGQSVVEAGLTCIELARVDGSMSTFLMVHNSLCMLTIDLLGSEEQKQQLLPDLAALKTVGAWGLTEPSNGSDASALQTTATKVEGGYELNGCKRWIGNATFADWVVIWARNNETNQVNAFVVQKGTKGFKTSKIENKISLRCVQNADIVMNKCFVPDSARLPGVNSFKVGTLDLISHMQHSANVQSVHSLLVRPCSLHA